MLAGCLLLTIGYGLVGDYTREVLFMTPMVVLMGAGTEFGGFAVERIIATLAGALVAGALATLLVRIDTAGGA